MKKIKVAEVIADSSLSGAPRHVLTLIKRLDPSQFLPILICPRGWLSKKIKNRKLKAKNIPLKNFFDLKSVFKLRKIINQENPDIIHLHGIRAGWLGMVALRQYRRKIIYTEHLYTKDYHLENWARELIQLQGLSYILKKVRIIIAPSYAVSNFLAAKFGISEKKIKVVYNGLEEMEISPCFARRNDKMRIGYLGSLNRQKGVKYLIRAFNQIGPKFPEVKLEIVGEGSLKNELRKKADGNIVFLGEKKNIAKYLSNWQMVIIPSLSESFGQTAVEAAMFSKPVVGSRVGGLIEVIQDQKTGLLVKPRNSRALAKAITYLLSYPNESQALGKQGRKRYEKLFTAKKMVKKTERIYQKISNIK